MSLENNLIHNPNFATLNDVVQNTQGEICDGWSVRSKGGIAHTKYDLTKIDDMVTLHVKETIGWFRLMQKLDLRQLKYKKLYFNIDCKILADDLEAQTNLDFIAILAVDAKGHATSHVKIFANTPINTNWQNFNKLFELPPLKSGLDYYVCLQLSEVCEFCFKNIELQEFNPYLLGKISQNMIAGAISAATKKQTPLAPYQNYGFSYYAQLATLHSNLSSRAKADIYASLSELIFIALRFEAYETAIGLVRYVLAKPKRMNEEQLLTLAPLIVATLQGVGETKMLQQFLQQNLDIVCGNDELFASFSFLLFNAGSNDKRCLKLPSGKTNAYLFSKIIAQTPANLRLNLTYDVMHCSQMAASGEQSLLLANCYLPMQPKNYLRMLNNYLSRFNLPNITQLNLDNNNIFQNIEFEEVAKIQAPLKVSVIIAGYNCSKTIAYALSSILQQSYQNIEVLFCDDSSDDETLQVVERFKYDARLKIYSSAQNQGCYNIRNQLIALSSGEFITFHDSDDYAIPTRIEMQLEEALTKNALLCLGRWLRVHNDGSVVFFKDHVALRMCVNSIMFRREIFEIVGKYRSVLCGADSEFFERARALFGDGKIAHVKAPMVLGLWSDSSMTRQIGTEALDNGYRAPKRRSYAEIASRQRALGNALYEDAQIDEINRTSGIYRDPAPIAPYQGKIGDDFTKPNGLTSDYIFNLLK